MEYINDLWTAYSPAILDFAVAMTFLLAFYIAACILRAIVKKLTNSSTIDNKLAETAG